MNFAKTEALISKLYLKTTRGEMQWEESPKPNTFNIAFPKYIVELSVSDAVAIGNEDYTLRILNMSGELVEEVTDVDMKRAGMENAYQIMKDIYEAARSIAMGVDAALDEILSELDDGKDTQF